MSVTKGIWKDKVLYSDNKWKRESVCQEENLNKKRGKEVLQMNMERNEVKQCKERERETRRKQKERVKQEIEREGERER